MAGYRIWVLPGSLPPSPGSGSALATLSPKGEGVADRAAAPSSPQRGEGGRAERGRMRGQLPICDCPVVRMAGYRILGFIWIRAPSPGSGFALATLSPRGEEVAGRAAAPSSPQRGEGGRAERGRMRGQLPICNCPGAASRFFKRPQRQRSARPSGERSELSLPQPPKPHFRQRPRGQSVARNRFRSRRMHRGSSCRPAA